MARRNSALERELLDLFEKFLLDNNIYSQFSIYLLEHEHITIEDIFDYFWESYKSIESIAASFLYTTIAFCDTNEGFDYWFNKHCEWQTVLTNYLLNS